MVNGEIRRYYVKKGEWKDFGKIDCKRKRNEFYFNTWLIPNLVRFNSLAFGVKVLGYSHASPL